MRFKHVIIYGWKLHSHTHSYIHNAFYRAFQHLGYDTLWVDDSDDLSGLDLTNSLFLTEGQACKNMPIIPGCKYILHNLDEHTRADKWEEIRSQDIDFLKIQVYTDDVLNYQTEKLEPCIHYDKPGKMLYLTWATDLLPHEISLTTPVGFSKTVHWIGTMGGGIFGNLPELSGFIHALKDNGIAFEHACNLSVYENRKRIAESYMAPAIVGAWQKEKGYVPCRIFKNISYGQYGMTNSARVAELFENRLVYSPNEYELFGKMLERRNSSNYANELKDLIQLVMNRHTYINRINTILSCI